MHIILDITELFECMLDYIFFEEIFEMKKVLYLMLVLLGGFSFFSCISASTSNLKPNGDYEDKGVFDYLSVKKVDSLSEFGITYDEWNAYFIDTILYKAHSQGDDLTSEEKVIQRACDAINIVGTNQQKQYVALFYQNSECKVTKKGNPGAAFLTGLAGNTSDSYIYEKYWIFDCYALLFDDLNLVSVLRSVFGTINVYTLK